MATTNLPRPCGAPARNLLERGLRVVATTALLVAAPLLAPRASAQQPAAIRASAYVSTSILAVALRSDSAPVALRASLPPATRSVRVAGVGTVDVQVGPGEAIGVSPQVLDPQDRLTVTVQVFNMGS